MPGTESTSAPPAGAFGRDDFAERLNTEIQRREAARAGRATFGADFGQRLNDEIGRREAGRAARETFGNGFGERLNEEIGRRAAARVGRETFGDDFGRRLQEALAKRVAAPVAPAEDGPTEPAAPKPVAAARSSAGTARPSGRGAHVVSEQDCIYRLAGEHGHWWETLWDDPGNAELRAERGNPGILLPGDRVHIPPLREKFESGNTEMRHRFRKKSEPSQLHVVVKENDEPRRNAAYVLTVDGERFEGVTDAEGQVIRPIPPRARKAELQVEGDERVYEIAIGRLDPVEADTGVQQRLSNLGFDCGQVDGVIGPRTTRMLKAFQESYGLEPSGVADAATRAQLVERHGS